MSRNNTLEHFVLEHGILYTGNYTLAEFKIITNEYAFTHKLSHSMEFLFVFLFSTIVLFGFCGNALLVYVIISKSKLKSSRCKFVFNLAISDILTCILCIPFTAVRLLLNQWYLGEMICKLVPVIQALYIFVSSLTVVTIAIDRYQSIVNWPKVMHKSNMKYVFLMIWMFALALALPMFVFHQVETVNVVPELLSVSVCVEKWNSYLSRGIYTLVVFLFHFALPIVTISMLHFLICKFIGSHFGSKLHSGSNRGHRYLIRQRKNVLLLTAIAVSFAFTWLPWTCINLIADFSSEHLRSVNINLISATCHVLAMSSVCVNPIVYGWFNSIFRQEIELVFRKICFGRSQRNDQLTTADKNSFFLYHKNTTMSYVRHE
ncbi:neuropeptide Y receptor type 5-like [Saccostrea echinata]|uniref:neuropeptide Y receptor type 5-like n=1 Tax=Saccostrea echinata TaxID=191078 RepID=UPI002A80564E|nr:neuropeptide Y receptor type 5-like [Saccostrea echinata]